MNPSDLLHHPPLGRQESLSGTNAFEPYHSTGSLPPFNRADSSDGLQSMSLKEIHFLSDGLLPYEGADTEEDLLAADVLIEPIALIEPIDPLVDDSSSTVLMGLPKGEEVEVADVEVESVCPVSPESTRTAMVSPDPPTSRYRGHDKSASRFRNFQARNWSQMFDLMCEYKRIHGDCMVPYNHSENRALARWVKRQRYQYKCLKNGKRESTMTRSRIKALEGIGFVWDSQEAGWNARFEELKQFLSLHGHCNVPLRYAANPALAIWVKAQRRQYKLQQQDRPSGLTQHRMDKLDRIGFTWVVRRGNKKGARELFIYI